MQYFSTITQKGQATIPIEIREMLGLKCNKKVMFVRDNEYVYIKPAKDFLDMKGSIKTNKKISNKKTDKVVAAYRKKQYEQKNKSR